MYYKLNSRTHFNLAKHRQALQLLYDSFSSFLQWEATIACQYWRTYRKLRSIGKLECVPLITQRKRSVFAWWFVFPRSIYLMIWTLSIVWWFMDFREATSNYNKHSVNSVNSAWIFMAFIKSWSIDFRNDQSPTCEVVHETNKAHFRNLLPNRFLPSSVGKALAWRSGGSDFQPHWGQFLTKFFLLIPV